MNNKDDYEFEITDEIIKRTAAMFLENAEEDDTVQTNTKVQSGLKISERLLSDSTVQRDTK